MAALKISIVNRQRCLRPDLGRLRRVLRSVLGPDARGELSVAIVDDRRIGIVHGEYLDDPSPTDVISFLYEPPGSPGPGPFGELVVSAETALRVARSRGLDPQEELRRYAIHGALHLLGHDDADPAGRRKMRRLERRFLRTVDC